MMKGIACGILLALMGCVLCLLIGLGESAGPPIKDGTIYRMRHEDAEDAELMYFLEGMPIYSMSSPEKWLICFEKDGKRREVKVTKECFGQYKIGDYIAFDK